MANAIHPSPSAVSYAQALLELANEAQQTSQIASELSDLASLVAGNATFQAYLADPSLGQEARLATLKRVLAGQISPLTMKFVGVLNEKSRLKLIGEIALAFKQLFDVQQNKVDVEVTVARALPADQLAIVQQKISTALAKNAVVTQKVDESIIGGLVLKVQDRLIDASVKYQLQAMKQRLLNH